jgi:hypothetical protein
VDDDLHGVAAVAFGFQPGAVADVEAEQQRPTGPQHPSEVVKDSSELTIGYMDDGPEGDQSGDRGVREM